MGKKEEKTLSWDAFQSLGNPDNAPEMPDDKQGADQVALDSIVRVHLEKKGRGGKTVCIIKGIDADQEYIKSLSKKLKSHCGVGGSVKNEEIIIQGDHRKKIMEILKTEGFKNVKPVGG